MFLIVIARAMRMTAAIAAAALLASAATIPPGAAHGEPRVGHSTARP